MITGPTERPTGDKRLDNRDNSRHRSKRDQDPQRDQSENYQITKGELQQSQPLIKYPKRRDIEATGGYCQEDIKEEINRRSSAHIPIPIDGTIEETKRV